MLKKRSAKRVRSTSAIAKPAACPWSEADCHTALTYEEVWFRDVEIETVRDGRGNITNLIVTSPKKTPDHPGVRLPSQWDKWYQLTFPPSFVLPKRVKRQLTPHGLEFSIPDLHWSVTIPYAWFDF